MFLISLKQEKTMKKNKTSEIKKSLLEEASSVLKNAYAPYSGYCVAAALLGKNGKIYTGVNVENASYGLTLCAEKTALAKAVSEGCRTFDRILILEKKAGVILPCGACRQVLQEFNPKMKVAFKSGKKFSFISLDKLLPKAFSL